MSTRAYRITLRDRIKAVLHDDYERTSLWRRWCDPTDLFESGYVDRQTVDEGRDPQLEHLRAVVESLMGYRQYRRGWRHGAPT